MPPVIGPPTSRNRAVPETFLAIPDAMVLPVAPDVTSRWPEILSSHLQGGVVFDLQLGATVAANELERVCSFNRGNFQGFPG